jgi:hypothetical protein
MTATASRGRTARKILGSLGVVGAAAAVAGMGTFGTFTDSTAPLNASVTSGTLSLDLNATNSTASLPMTASGFVPGDSISRSVDLVNSGNLAFAGLSLTSSATTSSLLDTDKTNGLQLSVKSCSVNWTDVERHHRRPGRHQLQPGRPGEPERRWHRPPRPHPVAAHQRRQQLPGQDQRAVRLLHRDAEDRHQPLTRLIPPTR